MAIRKAKKAKKKAAHKPAPRKAAAAKTARKPAESKKKTAKKSALAKPPAASSKQPPLRDVLKKNGVDVSKLSEPRRVGGRPVYQLIVKGADAVKTWEKLRKLVPETGYWPVITSHEVYIESSIDLDSDRQYVRMIAKELKRQTGKTYDASQGSIAMQAAAAGEYDLDAWLAESPVPEFDLDGRVPAPKRKSKEPEVLRSILDYSTRKPWPEVPLLLWPTPHGHEVPLLMQYGGWNACPLPWQHAAMLRHWHEQHDAEVLSVTHDIVELRIGNPPKTTAAAARLLQEHYAYCDEVLGSDDPDDARICAEQLKHQDLWWFWWD